MPLQMNPCAVIFDMDGVLIDSEPLWKIAEIEGFLTVGLHLTEQDCAQTTGLRIDEVVALWHERQPWTSRTGRSVEDVTQTIIDNLIREVQANGVPLPGAQRALQYCKERGLKVGLATSSTSRILEAVIDKLRFRTYFDVLCSAEHDPRGKPHPAVYLRCADLLGVDPNHCLAIEDSFNGLLSAKAACMQTVLVPERSHDDDPRFIISDHRIETLDTFPALVDQLLPT